MEILAGSHFKLPILKSRKESLFVTGDKYDLKAKIRNIGTNDFPGGEFLVHILWSNGPTVYWGFQVRPLEPNDDEQVNYGPTDVLSDGSALFYVRGADVNGEKIGFHNSEGNLRRTNPWGDYQGWTHLYTIIPKNPDSLYQLWALEMAVVALVILIVFQILDWCIRYYWHF
jgi:hypothetical protein